MNTALIDLPRFREAPACLVRNCRTMVPTAELVYMDDGAWYLGSVERTSVRYYVGAMKRRKAGQMHRHLAKLEEQDHALAAKATWMWWEGGLLMEGFAGIEVFRGEPDGRVEEFLRRRHYNWQRDVDAVIRKHLAEDDQEARGEDPRDKAASFSALLNEHKLKEARKWAFQRPKSFTSRQQKATA